MAYIGGFWKAIYAIGYILSILVGYEIFVKSVMKRLYFFEKNTSTDQKQDDESSSDDSINREKPRINEEFQDNNNVNINNKTKSTASNRRKSFASKIIE